MIDEQELLRRVRLQKMIEAQQAGNAVPMPPQPQMPQPVDATQGTALNNRAAQLEQQAQPAPGPRGFKENLVNGLAKGMEAFANPRTYAQLDMQRQGMEQQRQQDLLAKAQALRGQATQQNQFEQTAHQRGVSEMNDENFRGKTLANQEAQQKATAEHQKALLEQDQFASGPNGIYSKRTGTVTTPANPKAGNMSNFQRDTVNYNGKPTDVLIDVDPESPTTKHIFLPGGEDITGKTDHYESPAKYSEPFQTIFDPAQGTNILQRRGDVKPGAIAAQPQAVLKEGREIDNATRKLGELEKAYNPAWVGPAMGRYYKAKAALPGFSVPEGYGDFVQLQADLKNSMIKLITGAQMGREEADRILAQVPTENDKPEMWMPKFKRTKENAVYLQSLIDRQTGTKPQTPTAPGDDGVGFVPH